MEKLDSKALIKYAAFEFVGLALAAYLYLTGKLSSPISLVIIFLIISFPMLMLVLNATKSKK